MSSYTGNQSGPVHMMHPFLKTASPGRPFVPNRERPVSGKDPSRFRKPVPARQGRKIAVCPREQNGRIDIPSSIFEAWKRGHLQPGAKDLVSPRTVAPLSSLVVFLLDVSESM
ncbi:MAG: hypothetical protein KGY42_03665, partial [Desulfobacterales bacterium]|nr:hypothetical protein [Desulfobacterales bacterium]